MERVHFIAIGGSAMHNLAIALHKKGYHVSGSDDEIFEPSKSRLNSYGILPAAMGWNASSIDNSLDAIILGMHAREDNPELLKAQELGIKIYSYPEFLYEQSKNKKRVVIGGSHGKTTITAMILHVMNTLKIDCDYMVGAKLEGFDVMVKLTEEAEIMIIEGDEYLTSPIDRRPKFHLYKPDIAILTGIAWDHINVFPTFDIYLDQFSQFIDLINPNGALIYCNLDEHLNTMVPANNPNLKKLGYGVPSYEVDGNGQSFIIEHGNKTPLKVFGEHNLLNINGARLVCNELNINDEEFYKAISNFKGASNRLELIGENKNTKVFKDFAHSPSKLKATTNAVKLQFINRKLVACMELHTFSSLNAEFLGHYGHAMDLADIAVVFFSKHAIEHKKLKMISIDEVRKGFARKDLEVFTNTTDLQEFLLSLDYQDKNLLIMTSGNLDGVDLGGFANRVVKA